MEFKHKEPWYILCILVVLVFPITSTGHTLNPDILLHTSPIEESTTYNTNKDTSNRRSEGRTFFSFPEWYIVYSAEEYANHVGNGNSPSSFPYLDAMNQFWESVYKTKTTLSNTHSLDNETKKILDVIGVSFSVENIMTAYYESTTGRITYALNAFRKSPEDLYNDKVAKEYATFLHQTPWYEFPYFKKLGELWTKAYGINSISVRGIERRAILTTSYLFKGTYGAVIKKLARANFDEAALETEFIVRNISTAKLAEIPEIETLKILADGSIHAKTTRYRAFLNTALSLIEKGAIFVSIENNNNILVTLISGSNHKCLKDRGDIAFSMPILTEEPLKRIAILSKVSELHTLKQTLDTCHISIEHLYDY